LKYWLPPLPHPGQLLLLLLPDQRSGNLALPMRETDPAALRTVRGAADTCQRAIICCVLMSAK